MRVKGFVAYIPFLFILVSCQKIIFSNEEKSRNIYLENFHTVKFSGIFNIVLVQDSANLVEIKGKNNIRSIEAFVEADTLIINDNSKFSLNPGMNTITLHFTNLEYMVTYDPVNVSNESTIRAARFSYDAIGEIAEVNMTINCQDLIVYNSANTLGHFRFKGKADRCTLINRYGCSIFADSLYCEAAEIVNESIGDVFINATNEIKAYIWGSGNIYYYGNPVITIAERRGKGNIISYP